jgi:uncharacterized protein (TIGR03437 family)
MWRMTTRSPGAQMFTLHQGKSLTTLLAFSLIAYSPLLLAQQYCASGTVTSIQGCTGSACSFNVGDPVAMTFSVVPGSTETCTGLCDANASLNVSVGSQYWTSQNNPNQANGSTVSFLLGTDSKGNATTTVSLQGGATLSPLPATQPADSDVLAMITLKAFPGNLIPNGTIPSALPSPSAVAAANGSPIFEVSSLGDNSTAIFSYTGQTCATVPAAPAPPVITPQGIVPVYSSSTTIQPGSWISIFGTNLAAAPATWAGNFPTSLGNTSVTIDGKAGYLWYVSPTQINLQAPDDTATGLVNVVVTTAGGSVTSSVTLGQYGPSFSLLDAKHIAGIILKSDGSGAYGGGTYDIVGPTGTSLGYSTVAAKAGDVLELFGVGFGPTTKPVPAGQAFSGAAPTTNPVQLSINNVAVTPSFAGITSAGLYQINLTLPAGLGAGDVPLVATAGGVQTPSTVVLSVQ